SGDRALSEVDGRWIDLLPVPVTGHSTHPGPRVGEVVVTDRMQPYLTYPVGVQRVEDVGQGRFPSLEEGQLRAGPVGGVSQCREPGGVRPRGGHMHEDTHGCHTTVSRSAAGCLSTSARTP